MGAESISYFTKSSYSQMPASLLDRAKRRRHFGGARVGQARRSGRRGAPQCGFVFACLPLAILLEGAVGHLNCLQIDRGTRRPLGVKPDQALSICSTCSSVVFQRASNSRATMPLGRIDRLVAEGRERGFVFGLFKLPFPRAPALDRRPLDRLQRCLHSTRRDRVRNARSDRKVDTLFLLSNRCLSD